MRASLRCYAQATHSSTCRERINEAQQSMKLGPQHQGDHPGLLLLLHSLSCPLSARKTWEHRGVGSYRIIWQRITSKYFTG